MVVAVLVVGVMVVVDNSTVLVVLEMLVLVIDVTVLVVLEIVVLFVLVVLELEPILISLLT